MSLRELLDERLGAEKTNEYARALGFSSDREDGALRAVFRFARAIDRNQARRLARRAK